MMKRLAAQNPKMANDPIKNYYPFAISSPNDNEKLREVEIEEWVCESCGKGYEENCNCNSTFEIRIIKIIEGF